LSYLILGLALLAGVLLAGRWFVSADPKTLVNVLKGLLIGGIIAIAVFFVLTGRIVWAIVALPALLPWFIRLRQVARTAKAFHRMSQQGTGRPSGQASAVNMRKIHCETGIPLSPALRTLARKIGNVFYCTAKTRRTNHRTIRARQTSISHVLPFRMFGIVIK